MHHPKTFIVTYLSLFVCILAGCNRSSGPTDESKTPTTSLKPSQAASLPAAPATDAPPPKSKEKDLLHPVIRIETSLGNITVRLDAERCPLTVENFLSYMNAGHYDQTIVHQIYKGQGIVGGGYSANLVEKRANRTVRNEADHGLKNHRGTIAMVRQPDLIDSGATQFFINVADNPILDYKDRSPDGYGYCAFGEVTEGMEIIDRINETDVHDIPNFERTPKQTIMIYSIRQIK